MARTAAARKVAKAASTGSAGQGFKVNRSLIFPSAMVLVLIIGVLLVLFARDRRSDEAFVGNQHWYSTYDFYVCEDYENLSFVASQEDVPIRAEGDGLIHVQPFHAGVVGSTRTVGGFMSSVGALITDTSIELPDERILNLSDTTCEHPDGEGEADAELRVLRWNSVDSTAPAEFESGLANVRLGDNGQVVAFAVVHPDLESSEVPMPDTNALRLQLGLTDVGPTPAEPDESGEDGGDGEDDGDGGDEPG